MNLRCLKPTVSMSAWFYVSIKFHWDKCGKNCIIFPSLLPKGALYRWISFWKCLLRGTAFSLFSGRIYVRVRVECSVWWLKVRMSKHVPAELHGCDVFGRGIRRYNDSIWHLCICISAVVCVCLYVCVCVWYHATAQNAPVRCTWNDSFLLNSTQFDFD